MSDRVEVLPQVSAAERGRRWRLVLGGAADDVDSGDDAAAERDVDGDVPSAGDAGESAASTDGDRPGLAGDDARIDAALGALYDKEAIDSRRRGSGRAGGLGRSKPGVVRWLGDIRRYFPTSVVQVLQRDAVERLDLQQLLLEPELLEAVEPDIGLVTMLVELNRLLPDETRATARQVIARVLADVERQLADHTRQAVRGALARAARTRRPRPGDIDWPHTIEANLRHWLPEQRTIVPEQLIGHGRRQRSLARDVVIAVDQSGSMADSVVYASLFAGVLARLPTLRTRFYAFDTSITDLTPLSGLTTISTTGPFTSSHTLQIGNTSLTSLAGLENLVDIRWLELLNNTSLTSISALSNLAQVRGPIFVRGNSVLTNLDGLDNINALNGGALYIQDNPLLSDLGGVSNISTINASLVISNNDSLTDLDDFAGLEHVSSNINISYNDGLTNIGGLAGMVGFDAVLYIRFNTTMTGLGSLPNLVDLNGLIIYSNNQLASLDGLENVTNIGNGAGLSISYNNALTDIGALAVGISGSGPTVFALADDRATAETAAAWLREHYVLNEKGFAHVCRAELGGARSVESW